MSLGGGGGANSSSSTTKDYTPKIYKKQRGVVARELLSRIGGDVAGVQGPFVAPITPGEQAGLDAFQANAFGAGGLGQAADAQIAATLSGFGNPFSQAAVDAAIRPVLENAELKELRDRALFTGAGQKIQSSSAFTEDRARSIRDTERNVGDIATQIAMQERQNQLAAVTLANARLTEQREGITALALPRLIAQFGIDKANEEMRRRFAVMEQALSQLAGLTTPTLGTNTRSSGGQGNFFVSGTGDTSGVASQS